MQKFIICISNGIYDLPIGLPDNKNIDWNRYLCQTISPSSLPKLKQLVSDDKNYIPLFDILNNGFYIKIFRLKSK